MKKPRKPLKKPIYGSQDKRLTEANMRDLRAGATRRGIPFIENGEISPEERMHIVGLVLDDAAWILEVPGFIGLWFLATSAVMRSLSEANDVFSSDKLLDLLLRPSDDVMYVLP